MTYEEALQSDEWKLASEIKPGDMIEDEQGKRHKVKDVSPGMTGARSVMIHWRGGWAGRKSDDLLFVGKG